jgi:hypothetical protein
MHSIEIKIVAKSSQQEILLFTYLLNYRGGVKSKDTSTTVHRNLLLTNGEQQKLRCVFEATNRDQAPRVQNKNGYINIIQIQTDTNRYGLLLVTTDSKLHAFAFSEPYIGNNRRILQQLPL